MECGKTNNLPWLSTLVSVNKFTDNISQVTNLLLNFWNILLEIWSLSLSQLHRYPFCYRTNWGNFAQLSYWYCSRITHSVNNIIFKNFDCLLNRQSGKAQLLLHLFAVNILPFLAYLHCCYKICTKTDIVICNIWFFITNTSNFRMHGGFFWLEIIFLWYFNRIPVGHS